MKTVLLATIVVLFFACTKTPGNRICNAFFEIDSTITPRSATTAIGISSIIDCYGPNLCYRYAGMDITVKSGNVFEIKAKGTIYCEAQVCAMALYQVRDTIQINTAAPGTYYLKFYNNTSLFKTDTIIIN